jgi:hypothetical protein
MIGWLPRGFSVPRLCVEQDADQQARLGPSIAPAVVHALDGHCVERFQQDLIFVQDAVDLPSVGMALRRTREGRPGAFAANEPSPCEVRFTDEWW